MNRGKLDPRASALLRWTAALFDGFIVYVLVYATTPIWKEMQSFALQLTGLRNQVGWSATGDSPLHAAIFLFVFLVFLFFYWLFFEILLGGRTPGRTCLALEMRMKDGSGVKSTRRTLRGVQKVLSLGLSNLSFQSDDACDRRLGIVWWSPLAPSGASAMRNCRLSVESGPYQGHASDLERLDGFNAARQIKIGRDATWSDIPLDRDANVSNRHLLIRLRNGAWEAQDFGGGRGSTNGTWVNGKRLAPMVWSGFTLPAEFSLAGTRLTLRTQ